MASSNSPAVPGTVVSSDVNPAAIIQPNHSAIYDLGEMLKRVIHAVPGAFQNENELLSAEATINKFVSTGVPAAAVRVLGEMVDSKAPVEDVSLRTPPTNGAPVAAPASASPAIDYDKLAAALIAAQQRAVATVEGEDK